MRSDPRAYRARVLYFARTQWHALREHRMRLSEAQFLDHLEVLFPADESGPGDRFELSWWWTSVRPHYTLHLRGQDGMRLPQTVDHVGALHERAVLAWVRRTTRARRMDPWGMHIGAPPPYRPPYEFLDACLFEFPGAQLARLQVERQEGYVDPPDTLVEPSIHVEASLAAPDGGLVLVYLGDWPAEEHERLEEWAREMLGQAPCTS